MIKCDSFEARSKLARKVFGPAPRRGEARHTLYHPSNELDWSKAILNPVSALDAYLVVIVLWGTHSESMRNTSFKHNMSRIH